MVTLNVNIYQMTNINQSDKIKFYTNGIKTVKVKPGAPIPDGYYLGRTFNSNPWNKNLTKDTDERVKQNGEKTKQTRLSNNSYNAWNKGLTKETNKSLQTVSDKVKTARTNKFWASTTGRQKTEDEKLKQSIAMQGKEPWNKGLTKETNDRVKATADKLTGHKCFVTDWEKAKEKEYLTKKLNNSFNTSKPEITLYNELKNEYGEDNVIYQYRDLRYKNPNTNRLYNCDFYIKSLDLFIELNFHWAHGGHPFNDNDKDDFEKLCNWQLKATQLGAQNSYLNAIYIWTEKDPEKLKVLRENNLNFMIIYPNGLVIDK